MSLPSSLASLIASIPQEQILAKMLFVAQTIGINTESWQTGDPTRAFFMAQSARQGEWEDADTGFPAMIGGGFLGIAEGPWLSNLTQYNYNTPRTAATYATPTQQLVNTTAADFGSFEIDDVTVSDPSTGATFRNAAPFSLGPNQTVSILFEADVAGSASNADEGDITELVTVLDGVTTTNTTAAVGFDDEEDGPLTARAQSKFESTSPNGPRGAYTYAITTPSMQSDGSNQTNVTRVRPIEDDDYGQVVLFIAGDDGELTDDDATKANATIQKWSEPLVIDSLAVLASNVVIDITYTLYVYDTIGSTTSDIEEKVADFLASAFKGRPIGGDRDDGADEPGFIFVDWIRAQIIQAVTPYAFKCEIAAPTNDVPLNLLPFFGTAVPPEADVAVIGTITPTINIIEASQ